MFDLFDTLPWQHQILFLETLASAMGGMILASTTFRRSKTTMCWFLVWNAALFVLLISGADHFAWQYATIFAWYTLDTLVVVYYHQRGRVTTPEDFGPGLVFSAAIITTALLTLLVTGN